MVLVTSSRILTGNYESLEALKTMWQNSMLAAKIGNVLKQDLDNIWNKALPYYSYTNPPGWVGHGPDHIKRVLVILESLIPQDVLEKINEIEAFILIVGSLLHDIGMILPEGAATNTDQLSKIREQHGKLGAEIVRDKFADFLDRYPGVQMAVCEVVKNHHGAFHPQLVPGIGFNVGADALWVRLADELDFGNQRAPSFLMEYVQPGSEQLKHWKKHNHLNTPVVDIDLLRVQVSGTVQDHLVLRKLRDEFENEYSQTLQQIFLDRSRLDKSPRAFLIWDCTVLTPVPGSDSHKSIDPRPSSFGPEQYLWGARFLYNLGRCQEALECFELGKNAFRDKKWTDEPLVYHYYHYIKTLGGLGHYQKMLDLTVASDSELPEEVRAAFKVSRGLAYWKLGNNDAAQEAFESGVEIYRNLSAVNPKHQVNEADAHSLIAIVLTEKVRESKHAAFSPNVSGHICTNSNKNKSALNNLNRAEVELDTADKLFSAFAKYSHNLGEQDDTHYRGRYWGAMAFFKLLDIEFRKKCSEKDWAAVLDAARLAHDGMRNPFGAMCGKYCETAVQFQYYLNCNGDDNRRKDVLRKAARLIKEVYTTYMTLFGRQKDPVPRLWDKMISLLNKVCEALAEEKIEEKELSEIVRQSNFKSIELYTPLH